MYELLISISEFIRSVNILVAEGCIGSKALIAYVNHQLSGRAFAETSVTVLGGLKLALRALFSASVILEKVTLSGGVHYIFSVCAGTFKHLSHQCAFSRTHLTVV